MILDIAREVYQTSSFTFFIPLIVEHIQGASLTSADRWKPPRCWPWSRACWAISKSLSRSDWKRVIFQPCALLITHFRLWQLLMCFTCFLLVEPGLVRHFTSYKQSHVFALFLLSQVQLFTWVTFGYPMLCFVDWTSALCKVGEADGL